ncbi:Similar to At1g12200: Flavin-containing monooxygenase FMO GS-OX-like 2 (Arabidopsis thaliana) [Cotesia congregata]|uniref:Flavin-containing monooxygenase n=1 Tax=Cotesia congregata TaxID=51543 RepID=A0A8J2EKH6_COTCN|nr:Similar to At1g12200: Flavin-containing monooxygenase FMO GS-OX-like 2 (Arabidopsis thaliana) [Cotesia congregata]
MSGNIETTRKKIKICVIGAGAAGLCAIRHLSNDLISFEPAVFEQSEVIGGTWVYSEKTQADLGHPIHSSMYKNLRTNLPLQLMNFPDFQRMDQTEPSCGTHEQIQKKSFKEKLFNEGPVNGNHRRRCKTFKQGLDAAVQRCLINSNHRRRYEAFKRRLDPAFNMKIINVEPILKEEDWRKTEWKVTIKNLKTDLVEENNFDAVLICNGHYSEPKIPKISGIETFSGDVMHSHDYRCPEKYTGKTVIILGAGPSGIDIGIEITGYATHVYLSHNGPRFSSALPQNMTEITRVKFVNGNEFHLTDATTVVADDLLYCTGYNFSFPFLDETCHIKVDNDHVNTLFNHLINIKHPKMAFVGIPFKVIPFPMFHIQVQYFLKLLRGQVTLPSLEVMIEDSKVKTNKAHALEALQWEYNDYLADAAGIDKLPKFYKIGYSEWSVKRTENLLRYKYSKIEIIDDQTVKISI